MARKPATRKAASKRRPGSAKSPGTKGQRKRTSRPAGRKTAGRKTAGRKTARAKAPKGKAARTRTAPKARRAPSRPARKRVGGTGRESTLAQTPETGRTVKGPTNPMPTKRSTGTAAGAGNTRRAPGLERARKQLREVEEHVPTPPSSLDPDRRRASAARSGRRGLRESLARRNEVSPEITAGDVDADWEAAYSVGDEAPGGDNPTPDQDRVDDIGKALGVQYEDNEELKASDKIAERDRKRWELDPASSEDYPDRGRDDE